MSAQTAYYTEAMAPDELDFLVRKAGRERRQYRRVYAIFIVVSFVAPYVGAWYRVTELEPMTFSYPRFFTAAGILLFISTVSVGVSYRRNLRQLQRDIREQQKIIYITHVTRKVQVPGNTTFHLYLDSHVKLSIEVSAADYLHYNEGDEVSIEFALNSKEYLGYF